MFGLLLDELLGRFVPRGDAGFCPSGGAQMMTQVAQATAASQLDTGFHRIVDIPVADGGGAAQCWVSKVLLCSEFLLASRLSLIVCAVVAFSPVCLPELRIRVQTFLFI